MEEMLTLVGADAQAHEELVRQVHDGAPTITAVVDSDSPHGGE